VSTGLRVEAWPGGVRTDISALVRYASGVHIERGRSTVNRTAGPSTAALTVDNADGRFTVTSPRGPWYGLHGIGTQYSVSVDGPGYLWCERSVGAPQYASCPDSAALSFAGDLDVAVDVDCAKWQYTQLAGKYVRTGNQRSWGLWVSQIGSGPDVLVLSWSADGTTILNAVSTVGLPQVTGRMAVRATLDVNNGASGNTATFYTAATIAGPWTQLGAAVTAAGVTSLFDSTAPLVIGDQVDGPNVIGARNGYTRKRYYAAVVRSGIAGTVVASPTFTAASDRAASLTDAQGNVWTPGGGAELRARSYRHTGELAASAPDQDQSGADAWADLTIGGALRRLQKDTLVESAYTRALSGGALPSLAEWWPMEDPSGSTQFGSGLAGGAPAVQGAGGGMSAAANSSAILCSTALPTVSTASVKFSMRPMASGASTVLWFSQIDPNAVIVADTPLLRINYVGGTVRSIEMRYVLGNDIYILVTREDGGTNSFATSAVGWARTAARWALVAANSGSDIALRVGNTNLTTGTTLFVPWTMTGQQIGRPTSMTYNPSRVDMQSTVLGQVSVHPVSLSLTAASDPATAYAGETALDRFERLADEVGIIPVAMGTSTTSTTMGPMSPGTRWDQLAECETASHGVLADDREAVAIVLAEGTALGRATGPVGLSFTGGDLVGGRPVMDDSLIENTITVEGVPGVGGTAIYQATDGISGSTLAGEREVDYTVSTATTAALRDHAAWMAHEGTPAEPVWDGAAVHLARAQTAARADALRALDIGDTWRLTGAPAWSGADDADQVVVGLAEDVDQLQHRVSLISRPGAPYRAGRWSDSDSGMPGLTRWAPGPCTLASAATAGATTLSVAVSGWQWGHGDGDYTITVGGERCTVTAVGAPSAGVQALTVVRGGGGWAAAHPAGTAVDLADGTVWLWRA